MHAPLRLALSLRTTLHTACSARGAGSSPELRPSTTPAPVLREHAWRRPRQRGPPHEPPDRRPAWPPLSPAAPASATSRGGSAPPLASGDSRTSTTARAPRSSGRPAWRDTRRLAPRALRPRRPQHRARTSQAPQRRGSGRCSRTRHSGRAAGSWPRSAAVQQGPRRRTCPQSPGRAS